MVTFTYSFSMPQLTQHKLKKYRPSKIAALKITCLIFLSLCFYISRGQGCSDAGFCTINSFKPGTPDSLVLLRNQVKSGVFYGAADHSITVYGSYIEYNRQLNEKWGADLRLTSLGQTGNDISVFGLSDLYLNTSYKINNRFTATAGIKIPLTRADREKNNLPLPMDYQASLGTFDFIFGVGYSLKKIQLVLAIQQPISQNANRFFADQYPPGSKLRDLHPTNHFKRMADVLFRASYPIVLSKKIRVTPGILPIYHLKDDRYTDASGVEKEIVGSQGLTLNGNLYIDYEINRMHAFQFNAGVPFITRDRRPDGLTRSFIVNLEYQLRF